MIKFRNKLIKNLIKSGIPKSHITYTRAEGFDVVIVRDSEEAMFFLKDNTDCAEIIVKKPVEIRNRSEVLEKLNKLNLKYGLTSCSLLEDRVCIRMWTKYDLDDIRKAYQKSLDILKDF